MNSNKIAIIDVIGLTYDGDTLQKYGLGGSESAVILMSQELVKLGYSVTVFNNCDDNPRSQAGVYNGVKYIDLSSIDKLTDQDLKFDIVISSRTVIPFLPPQLWDQFAELSPHKFKRIKEQSQYRVVWMHDTFCRGDHLLEDMVRYGDIHRLFTLSDFHTTYVANCDHGRKRMFEVLKRHMFMTRNGVVNYYQEVDVTKKDPHLYVFNASVTKGMLPLVQEIWEPLKRQIPQARLKVIGGYYRMRETANPDDQEIMWRQLVVDPKYAAMDIEFTGIIRQSEIADILAKSSYMIYPADFPETFGISSLESLTYNTPLITCRFGALEETAVEKACYLIDYPVKANSLFPAIDTKDQINRFIDMAVRASQDRYLHQQKMYYCNIVKDICGWDSVALQWKQHFVKQLGQYLTKDEYRRVSQINHRVHEVFGRRFINPEELYVPRRKEQRIVIVTPMYNAAAYIERCIESVITQDYDNYHMYVIDDASTDLSLALASKYISDHVTVIANQKNQGAVANQLNIIKNHCAVDDIIMLLDGDDSLVNNNQIFHYYNNLYDGSTEFSYGSCWSMVDNIPLIAQHYPKSVKQNRTYRQHKFNWNMPYTHLRTFLAGLIQQADIKSFQDEQGNYYRAGGDGSMFYTAIEAADPNKVKVVTDIVYNYNDASPLNDFKINGEEQTRNANKILGKSMTQDLMSVIIPTMWRCQDIFLKGIEQYVAHPLVGEILIVNNDMAATPPWPILNNPKVRLLNQFYNIKVNPAWNLAVAASKYDKLALANDDIEFDGKLIDRVMPRITPDVGLHGIIYGRPDLGQPETVNDNIDFAEWKPGDCIHPYGQIMFIHKQNYVPVIKGLNLYFGDDWLFHHQLMRGRKNYMIYNLKFYTPGSQTVCDPKVNEGTENEKSIWEEWFSKNPIPQADVASQAAPASVSTPQPKPISMPKKRILIAVPTARNIEVETFKSIYDLTVPDGYDTEFQYFYGYQIDQIRNLIGEWAKHYDYLFSVDSDIILPKDTLVRMLSADKDMISGLYIQRKPGQHILELYQDSARGGVENIPYAAIKNRGVIPVAGCGFGCVLIKADIFRKMPYPHFVYQSAIDHANTLSEDIYFCNKARSLGYTIWADTSIQCEHIGSTKFIVDHEPPKVTLDYIAEEDRLPVDHQQYLPTMNINPKVIYDIGACVLHWQRHAAKIWPTAKFVLFDGEPGVERVLANSGCDYHIGLLTDRDNRELKFYHNIDNPGGNSYYQEVTGAFGEEHADIKIGMTLDTIVEQKGYPLPDLIKLDIQGAELDVLRGASRCVAHCNDIILEAQHKTYNKGAPHVDEVIAYMDSIGFELVANFSRVEYDGDYHFKKKACRPTKVYIIKNNNDISNQYSKVAAKSCEHVGAPWEYFLGYENLTRAEVFKDYKNGAGFIDDRAACATASHFALWKKIYEQRETAVILEHDSLILHPIDFDIPDNCIVALGYKFKNPAIYDHVKAGPVKEIIPIPRFSGAHAYAITWRTAKLLLDELEELGVTRAVDNFYFMRINEPGDTESRVPLAIASPTPAICWLRKSTIWNDPSTLNYDLIDSFTANLRKG
jgi:FkbM family methyltransferase